MRSPAGAQGAGTVNVAPPTGARETDRASILAALELVQSDGTIHFAPGTYLVGELIRVTVPGITLRGHPDGTTLRGCDPEEFVEMEVARYDCNGLDLTGGRQTVRGLTFEYASHALHIGCCAVRNEAEEQSLVAGERLEPSRVGGYRVEENTFRYVQNGIRVIDEADEPTVVRGNRFIDTYHAIAVHGRTVHFLDNEVTTPDPARVPFTGHPGGALALTPVNMSEDLTSCAHNVVAGNRIEGHPDAILIWAWPGTACRHNVIRDNTIAVQRVRFPASSTWVLWRHERDSTVVGVPITLHNDSTPPVGPRDEAAPPGVMQENVIEGNRLLGAEGVGIELLHASRNRIVNNTISGIAPRDPFPGNTLGPPPAWREANGAGVWLSPGSHENEIVGNTFADIAAHAIVVEGDGNTVETRSAADAVRDLGADNQFWGPDGTIPRDP
jgi:parallel beta-helix repeat protein